jgi:parallel beta-helix repeat protein
LGFIGVLVLNGFGNGDGVFAANSLYVSEIGAGNHTSIQDAIDNATSGDTIYVWAGEYFENIIINKTVTIIGNGSTETVINGSGVGDVVLITADWVNLSGIKIINSGKSSLWPDFDSSIKLKNVSNIMISEVECSNSYCGIYLNEAENNYIFNNSCEDNILGIQLNRGTNNSLQNNSCKNNSISISLEISKNNSIKNSYCNDSSIGIFLSRSDNNSINDNDCWNNNYGISLRSSRYNLINKNKCLHNKKDGITIISSSYNVIKDNNCSYNDHGIYGTYRTAGKLDGVPDEIAYLGLFSFPAEESSPQAPTSKQTNSISETMSTGGGSLSIILGTDSDSKPGQGNGYLYRSGSSYYCYDGYYMYNYQSGSTTNYRGWAVYELNDLKNYKGVKVTSAYLWWRQDLRYYIKTLDYWTMKSIPYDGASGSTAQGWYNEVGGSGSTKLGSTTFSGNSNSSNFDHKITVSSSGITWLNSAISGSSDNITIGSDISALHTGYSYGYTYVYDMRIVLNFTYTGMPEEGRGAVAMGDDLCGYAYSTNNYDIGRIYSSSSSGAYAVWNTTKIKALIPTSGPNGENVTLTGISVRMNSAYGYYSYNSVYDMSNDPRTTTSASTLYNDARSGTRYFYFGNSTSYVSTSREFEWDLGADGLEDLKDALDGSPNFFALGFTQSTSYLYLYSPKLVVHWEVEYPPRHGLQLGADNPEYPGQAHGYSRMSGTKGYIYTYYYTYTYKTSNTDYRGWATFDLNDVMAWEGVEVKSARLVMHNYYRYYISQVNFTALKTTPYHSNGSTAGKNVWTESGPTGIQIGSISFTTASDTTYHDMKVELNEAAVKQINNTLRGTSTYKTFGIGFYVESLLSGYTYGYARWNDIRLELTFEYSKGLQPTTKGNGTAFGDCISGHFYKRTSASYRPYGYSYLRNYSSAEYRGYYQWNVPLISSAFEAADVPNIEIKRLYLRFNHRYSSLSGINVYHLKYNMSSTTVSGDAKFTDCGDGAKYYGPATVGSTYNEYEWELNSDAVKAFQDSFEDGKPDYFGVGLVATSTSGYSYDYGPRLVIEWDFNYDLQDLGNNSNNIIENNICLFNKIGGIYLENSNNNTITKNYFSQNGYHGIIISNSFKNVIENNSCNLNQLDGINLKFSALNTIFKNNISRNTGYGIFLQNNHYNSIANNSCNLNYLDGIYLISSNHNMISNNTISQNTRNGIYLQDDYNNLITNNICHYNNDSGIYSEWSIYNYILYNNLSFNSKHGFKIFSSENLIINNNTCIFNEDTGIAVIRSESTAIINCRIYLNKESDLRINHSKKITLNNNTMIGKGFQISGTQLDHWNSHAIDSLNLINNKPIYYFKNQNSQVVPQDAGQVILANCYSMKATKLNLTNSSYGMQVAFSNNNYIDYNQFYFNDYGIYLYNSDLNIISKSTFFSNNEAGIHIQQSDDNEIVNCTFDSNNNVGIIFDLSENCQLTNSSIKNTKNHDVSFKDFSYVYATQCSLNQSKINFEEGTSYLVIQWFMFINVTNETGVPVPNASVQVKNSYNSKVYSGLTDESGWCHWILCKEIMKQKSSTSYYTPHNISVTKLAHEDAFAVPEPTMNRSKIVHIILRNDITPPAPPANLKFNEISDTFVRFSWDQPNTLDVYGYNIYINATGSSTKFVLIGSTTNMFYNATGLFEEIKYYFEIRAVDEVPLESEPLMGNCTTIDKTKPSPPTGLKVINCGGTFIELSWTNSTSNDVMGFQVFINNTGSISSFHHLTNTTLNHINISGLVEETSYYIKIRAFDEIPFYSVFTPTIFATTLDITPPSKPTGLKVTPDGKQITLTWNSNPEPDISGYQIYMNNTGAGGLGPFHFVKSVDSTIYQTIVDGLIEETKYYFLLIAFDERPNYSPISEIVSTTTLDITPPLQPTGLVATGVSATEIHLFWDSNTENDLEGYLIYMKDLSAGGAANFYLIQIILGPNTTLSVKNLEEENTYQFKIKAFDEVPNNSSFSLTAEGTTLDETPPVTPTGLFISKSTKESLSLRWDKNPDSDVVGYNIFRRKSNIIKFQQINNEPIDDTKYMDSGLRENTEYYYKITAVDEANLQSDFSKVASGKTLRIEFPPEINNTVEKVIMKEDTIDEKSINLYHLFKDGNNDQLYFWYEGGEFILIDINYENGNVTITPIENYWGSEKFTFFASDEITTKYAKQEVIIDVRPVNDPPHGLEILAPHNNSRVYDGESFEFMAECYDVDLPNDELIIRWYYDNLTLMGTGEILKDVILDIGVHKITVLASDSHNERVYDWVWVVVLENPENADSDYDDDGMPNDWERKYGLDENNSKDGFIDWDNDGLNNFQEFFRNTDPLNSDTDSDGLVDGYEIKIGTDPTDNDTDKDQVNDNLDAYPLDPEKWKIDEDEVHPTEEIKEPTEKDDSVLFWSIMGAIIVTVIVLLIILLLIILRNRREEITTTQTQQQLNAQVGTSRTHYCSTCSNRLYFINQTNGYYCYSCRKYE